MSENKNQPATAGVRLVTNTAVFAVGKLLSKLLVFCMTWLYTTCLTRSEYSTADLVVNMANLLIVLACVGVNEGIFRAAAARSGNKEAYLTNGLFILVGGSAVFLVLSPLISLIPIFKGYAWLIALYVVVANLHTVVAQYLCAVGRTRLFAGQGLLNTALVIIFNILFLPVLDFGVTGYVLATVLADLVTTVFLILLTRLWRSVKPRTLSKKIIRSLLVFCLPLVPTTLFWWITGVSDRYMVTAMCSSELNGLYTAAYKIPTLLIHVVSIFDSAWKLSVSAEEDFEACTAFYTRVWRFYTTIAFLGGAALVLFCRPLSLLLFGSEFHEAWVYIPVLTFATVFAALDTFLGSVYFASKRTMGSMLTALAGAAVNLILNLCLIPVWGAMGASIATFVSYFSVCVLRMVTTYRLIPFRREWLRGSLNTLFLGGVTLLVTLSGSIVPAIAWGGALALFALMLALNARPTLSLLKNAKSMLRGR